MCGIAGIFEYRRPVRIEEPVLARMLDALVHRGPDDSGTYFETSLAIGMRRLSIIDRSGGHQPLANEDGRVRIVFNGEIYNHHELRSRLQGLGHSFSTLSDTETIVHAYEQYGAKCVEHLDGMFAFAIWDARSDSPTGRRLFIARDRLGKKPLYFADTGNTLVFGSELKAVVRHPAVERELDVQALHDFLSLGQVPGEQTIFRHVRKLPPGHTLELDAGGGVVVREYWHWPSVSHGVSAGVPTVTAVKDLLCSAVEKRLESEVPLGVFLSGGLDSGVVAAIMSRLLARPVDAFSVGFEGPGTHNELPLARATAAHIGARHHEFVFRPDIVELLPEIVDATDEPFAISSSIPLLLLSRAARQQVTVVLTGDGGDEVLGGYAHYLYERWAGQVRAFPRSFSRVMSGAAAAVPGPVTSFAGAARKRVRHLLDNAWLPGPQRRLGWTAWFDEDEKWNLYSEALRRQLSQRPIATAQRLRAAEPGMCGRDPAEVAAYLDAANWLPDEMLTKVDRMTMSASIEARCPLLDRELVSYCARLPMSTRIPGNRDSHLKSILKTIAKDLLPETVLRGRKHGFNVPLDTWFRGGARSYLEHHLSRERIESRGLFDPDVVKDLIDRHMAGAANLSSRLFGLLTFEVWAEKNL
jgi:asparagine synthase (glutamine-hydrolysing)